MPPHWSLGVQSNPKDLGLCRQTLIPVHMWCIASGCMCSLTVPRLVPTKWLQWYVKSPTAQDVFDLNHIGLIIAQSWLCLHFLKLNFRQLQKGQDYSLPKACSVLNSYVLTTLINAALHLIGYSLFLEWPQRYKFVCDQTPFPSKIDRRALGTKIPHGNMHHKITLFMARI